MEEVKNLVEGFGYNVKIDTITKNGKEKTVWLVEVSKTDDENGVSAVFYPENYEGQSDEDIALSIISFLRRNKEETENISKLKLDFESCKDKIVIAVRQASHVDNVIAREFLDLEYYPRVIFDTHEGEITTGCLTTGMLNAWGKTEEEIYELGFENLRKGLRYNSVMGAIVGEENKENFFDLDTTSEFMYTVLNPSTSYGSGIIADIESLAEIGEVLGTDFYIIPSSVYEVIIVPDIPGMLNPDSLRAMVKEVNSSEVISDRDFLSNSLYKFFRDGNMVTFAF